MLLVAGAAAPAVADAAAALAARAEGWVEAFNAGDVDAIVALYGAEARLLPPNAELTRGLDAVRQTFGGWIEAGLKGDLATVETVVVGDLGYRLGTFTVLGDDGSEIDRGKFIEIWRQIDGEWVITEDIWNSDLPAAASDEGEAEAAGHGHDH
ncbi:MAG TPA: nuclear transport factor 2 family protein [Thermoanaerobaculia bacterium]|nr:nuclear transport factor 2 family protein [Thermoanaerobaculia bacterium]